MPTPSNAKNRNKNKGKNNCNSTVQSNIVTNIGTKNRDIFCDDRKVHLSDEKLKNLMLHVYETARRDANRFSWMGCYDILLSFAFALLIALLTANFKNFALISAAYLEKVAWGSFIVLLVASVILFFLKRHFQSKNENEQRDVAVKNALEELEKSSVPYNPVPINLN